jgi:4-amino-4-deoxy-L-arabinose transferase-like glycosyltransferase
MALSENQPAGLSLSGGHVRAWFYLCLALYFGLHVLIRVSMSDSLELDEAEQAFLTQWILLGYGSKPPLYTWLQRGFNAVFGLDVLSLSLLKNTLLFATYAFVFESGRILLKKDLPAALAAASLILLPQIGWESQRDLTHSVLVTALGAAAVYACLALVRSPRTSRYIAAGAVFGLGMMAKYNFALLAAALLAVLALHKPSRQVLKDRRALWIPALLVLLAAPYYGWFLLHLETAAGSVDKLDPAASGWLLPGLGSLAEAVVAFLTPLWIVLLAFFPPGRTLMNPLRQSRDHPALAFHMYFLAILGLFVAGVLVFHITEIKARWMQPLLLVFPVYLFSLVDWRRVSRARVKRFLGVVSAAAVLVLLLIPGRVVLGPSMGYTTNFNVPYSALADRIAQDLPARCPVFVPGSTLGGNLRLHMPDARVVDPVMAGQVLEKPVKGCERVAVAWSVEEGEKLPEPLRRCLATYCGIRPAGGQVRRVAAPYKYGSDSGREHVFRYLIATRAE